MKRIMTLCLLTAISLQVVACASPRYFAGSPPLEGATVTEMTDDPRGLPMFVGTDGASMSWHDLMDAVQWADVVIVGEQHDDAMGHAVQRAIVQDTLDRWPRSALSMEMLERDEQLLVDDYLDDIIDTAAFIRLTFSENWGGPGMWVHWFQPIVDAAKERNARVIAANAPRRYVRMARLSGYDALDALPRERRALFDRPRELPRNHYFDRFAQVMSHIENPRALDAMFRSQMVWDATMARSIINARPSQQAKVVHLVGRFHSDFEGGLVQELRRHQSGLRILTISMIRRDAFELRESDSSRADIVIYTGEPEADPEAEDGESVHPVHEQD